MSAMSLPLLRGRIPSLDGLRAVAIVLVLIGHLHGTLGDLGWGERMLAPIPSGDSGVQVFFVISGFLITTLLLGERAKTGSISLRNFYKRRALRIFPAYYAYVAAMVALGIVGMLAVSYKQAGSAALFVVNYTPFNDGWVLGHTWSLAVEEQFYLVWPLLLGWLGVRGGLKLALAGLVAIPLLRIALLVAAPDSALADIHRTHIRGDALLVGVVLAFLWVESQRFRDRAGTLLATPLPLVATLWLPVSAVAKHEYGQTWSFTVGYLFDAIAVGIVMTWVIVRFDSAPGRLLNSRAVRHIGVLSYSLYLWQQVFMRSDLEGFLGNPVVRIVCAFAAAELSMRFIEAPFRNRRQRLRTGVAAGLGDDRGVGAEAGRVAD